MASRAGQIAHLVSTPGPEELRFPIVAALAHGRLLGWRKLGDDRAIFDHVRIRDVIAAWAVTRFAALVRDGRECGLAVRRGRQGFLVALVTADTGFGADVLGTSHRHRQPDSDNASNDQAQLEAHPLEHVDLRYKQTLPPTGVSQVFGPALSRLA